MYYCENAHNIMDVLTLIYNIQKFINQQYVKLTGDEWT